MDEETFRAFYDRAAGGVWAYLARVTADRQMADDLLQETFYRFLRADAAHDSEAHRRNSLYRIATNLARDARRRSADFSWAMSRLKPRERAMLWLAYAEGVLGVRPGSLKLLLLRARHKLAGLLGRPELRQELGRQETKHAGR